MVSASNDAVSTLEILDRLIAFPTVSQDSNLPLIEFAEGLLRRSGFRGHRVSDATGDKAGIFAAIGPEQRGGILLSGHTDVVPVAGQNWTRPPFELTVAHGRAYGRGTTDMKGYVAAILALCTRAAGRHLSEPLKIALSYDEEVGCVGIKQMIGQLDSTIGLPRFCFVGEPTSLQIAVGHKGKVALRAHCRGVSGHSAMAPRFVNAIHVASDLVQGLRRLQHQLAQTDTHDPAYEIPYATTHVGRLLAGEALNMVPDNAIVDCEFRYIGTDGEKTIRQAIDQLITHINARYAPFMSGAAIDIEERFAYPGLETGQDDEIVTYASELTDPYHPTKPHPTKSQARKVEYGTEAGVFSQAGIPTIICGPGSMVDQGHKPDESILVDELAACDKMLGHLLDRLSV